MPDEKLENVLNLALEVPERERARSMDLNVGYSEAERTWDLIVKYTGDIGELVEEGAGVTELLTNYAVVTVPESQVEALTAHPRIEYVEKPKELLYNVYYAKRQSCFPNTACLPQRPYKYLSVRGFLCRPYRPMCSLLFRCVEWLR